MKRPLTSKLSRYTWLSYLKAIKCDTYEPELLQFADFNDFINVNGFAHSFLRHSAPFVYLLDYRTGLYRNMSENFAGYKSESFLKEGISHSLEIYQKDHLRLFDHEIFPDRLEILKNVSPDDHKDYIFSYNLCVKNRNGQFENLLQRNCFLSDHKGNPIFSMGMLININNFVGNIPVVQTVERVSKENPMIFEAVCKKNYYMNEEHKLFSKREKEVLLWMADGLSSKMIADKMCVSEHTVINHRRNMQDKTNAPNAIALVSLALKTGVI